MTKIVSQRSGGFSSHQVFLSTDTFVVPSGVYEIGFICTGGGNSGGNGRSTSPTRGGYGGDAGNTVGGVLLVNPSDSLVITVGGIGGTSKITRNGTLVAAASNISGGTAATFNNQSWLVNGGAAGIGGDNTDGSAGSAPFAFGLNSTYNSNSILQAPRSTSGTGADGSYGGGGGGGTSYYGVGGNGGNGGVNGENGTTPASTSYGAGGGGGGEGGSTQGVGGSGIQGIVEIWY